MCACMRGCCECVRARAPVCVGAANVYVHVRLYAWVLRMCTCTCACMRGCCECVRARALVCVGAANVYVHVRLYAWVLRMCTCTCACMRGCCECVRARALVYTTAHRQRNVGNVCMHVYLYNICMFIYICIYIYIYDACKFVYIYIHTHTNTRSHITHETCTSGGWPRHLLQSTST
jgi:hypothetical protein